MKKLLVLVLIALFSMVGFAQDSTSSYVTQKDTLVKDLFSTSPILLGYCNRKVFKDTTFSWWYNSMYDMYTIDTASVKKLAGKLKNVNIEVVMGTWCSDSRRQVPRLFKILDYLKYPADSVQLLMVGRKLKGINSDETKGLNIEKVPTIIFLRNGKELGRIIESPKVSLEKDMLKILS